MLNIFNYQVSLNLNPYLILLYIAVASLYVVYIYKYTIPQTSKLYRVILISIRTIILTLLFILLFEPRLTVFDTEEQKPIIPIFIDNSSSILYHDVSVKEKINELIANAPTSKEVDFEYFFFDAEPKKVSLDSVINLSFEGGLTNFEKVFNKLRTDERYITSAMILSDGIVNDGSSSIYQVEELNFPIYTIGIGDTTKTTDTYVKNILNNRFIYKETPTVIAAEISNQNLEDENAVVLFKENNRVIESKQIKLNSSGINRVTFDYYPEEAGKQLITVEINRLENETNIENNVQSKYIDVIENKLNLLVIGGSPSADFSAVYQSLNAIDEFSVSKYLQISPTEFTGDNLTQKLDSAEVIVLVDFPYNNTPTNIIQQVKESIEKNNTPFFNLIGSDIQLLNLSQVQELLPFTQSGKYNELYLAQPSFSEQYSSMILGDELRRFNNFELPPVAYPNVGFRVKPGSQVIAAARINNISTDFPMIVSQNTPVYKSITLIGSNVWRWRITSETREINFFDQLIYNFIQWLRVADNQRKFFVETSKEIYAVGETIEFIGEIYDDKLESIRDASIIVDINNSGNSFSLKLEHENNGIYKGELNIPYKGDYSFKAEAEIGGIKSKTYNGKFNIGQLDLEKFETVMQENYLEMIASLTGGAYYYIDNSFDMLRDIETINRNKIKRTTLSSTYDPLSFEALLLIIILLLTLEWFIRKKEGML